MTSQSPYEGLPEDGWAAKTKRLISAHPLAVEEMVEVTRASWNHIFASRIGEFSIGSDILPRPQVMGFFLHELIALDFEARYPHQWRRDQKSSEKDLVFIPNDLFSTEIKTSSSKNKIFGNRSYAQVGESNKKSKSGYFLAINFGKFTGDVRPEVNLIRFGWLDHSDWVGQKAPTGQQAHLTTQAEQLKLITLYEVE